MPATMLSKEAFAASRRFIETTARPLDIARFRHAFEGLPGAAVCAALRAYQNPDGGFGHALEPDLRTSESSALRTSIAFQVLRSIGAGPAEPLVAAGIAYLLKTLDREKRHWRIIPKSAENSPHAPWWNQAGREAVFESFSLNPTAELLGYLYDYHEQVPRDVLTQVTDRVASCLSGLDQIEMHELLCCVRLMQSRNLPEGLSGLLRRKLPPLVASAVAWDPAQWKRYSLRPIQIVDSPASPFLAGHEESIAANLDFEIASRNADGSWTPTWTWGGAFPDAWPLACREWSGILTLEKLLLLKRFGRIEGVA